MRIPIEADASAGVGAILAEDGSVLVGADGIAFDPEGNLYVAIVAQDRLALVSPDGAVSIVADGPPLQNPSDVAFGVGAHAETLFITNFAVLRALGIQEGDPQPALLALTAAPEEPEPSPTTGPA